MSCGPSAECWDSHSCQKTNVCVHLCVYVHVCVCGNCDEAKEWTYCPYCRPPLKRCTWLVGVCMCVYGTAVLQYYMGRVRGGDTDELQLWPWGLWELWLEQCGKRIRGKRKDERGREEIHWEKKRLQAETRWDGQMKREHMAARREDTREKNMSLCVGVLWSRKSHRDQQATWTAA